MHNYLRLLTSVELFRHLPKIVVTQLTEVLHSEIFITNDVLLKAGTRGEALYFIACGTVAVYNNVGKEVKFNLIKILPPVKINSHDSIAFDCVAIPIVFFLAAGFRVESEVQL